MNSKAVFVFLFFAALYAVFSIGHFGGDGYQDYLIAESIVLDGNLSLFDRPQDKDDLAYEAGSIGKRGTDGKIYSSRKGFGVAFILVPFYLAGHVVSFFFKGVPHDYITMLFVSFANPLITALSCMMVFFIAGRLGFGSRLSALLSLIYGLSTMAPVYARTGFGEPVMVLFMLLAVRTALWYGKGPGVYRIALTALLLSCMFVCKISSLIFVPCFLVYVIWVMKGAKLSVSARTGHFVLFSGVVLLVFSAILAANFLLFGDPFSFGETKALYITKKITMAPHVIKGFYYYLVSTGKGMFLYNIPVILALLAAGRAFKEDKKAAVLFLLIFAVNLLFFAKSFRRGSLFSWGPRYLLPSVPLLVLLSGYFLRDIRAMALKVAVFLSAAAGFLIMIPCMLVNQSKFYFFVVEKLKLEEYMINFMPDLCPIGGSWWMLVSGIVEKRGGAPPLFTYMPDYRLVEPVSSAMTGYNNMDLWSIKVANLAPQFMPCVYICLGILGVVAAFSFYKIVSEK